MPDTKKFQWHEECASLSVSYVNALIEQNSNKFFFVEYATISENKI